MHESITEERVLDAVERRMTTLDDPGFCTECGSEQGGCEPDANGIQCEACGSFSVRGADDLLMEII